MKKNIKVTVINDCEKIEFITSAIYTNDYSEIKYIDNDEMNTIVKYNFASNKFTRTNNNLKLEYEFSENNKTTGIIDVKDISKFIEVEIKTNKLIQEKGNLDIEYLVENQKIIYKIEVI